MASSTCLDGVTMWRRQALKVMDVSCVPGVAKQHRPDSIYDEVVLDKSASSHMSRRPTYGWSNRFA